MDHNDIFAVILAGGSGTRFWPKSRHLRPKQLCALGSQQVTMIEKTLQRIDAWIEPSQRLIVTHRHQAAATAALVGKHCPSILAEPQARNTAAALCWAALHIYDRNPQATMISFHADHEIVDVAQFRQEIQRAIECAQHGYLCLLGIEAKSPETGYGYIEKGRELDQVASSYDVESFREKPDRKTAQDYIDTGRFLWNSGIFVWKVQSIIEEFEKYLPDTLSKLQGAIQQLGDGQQNDQQVMQSCYEQLASVAIDHAILEKSDRVAVVPARSGWFDVGSWDSLEHCYGSDALGNLLIGDVFAEDVSACTIDASDGVFVGALGLKNLVVVACKDAVLVCDKSKAQDVRRIVDFLKSSGRCSLT